MQSSIKPILNTRLNQPVLQNMHTESETGVANIASKIRSKRYALRKIDIHIHDEQLSAYKTFFRRSVALRGHLNCLNLVFMYSASTNKSIPMCRHYLGNNFTHLKKVNISLKGDSSLSDEPLEGLGKTLANRKSIDDLKITLAHRNETTSAGVKRLIKQIKKLANLRSLSLNLPHIPSLNRKDVMQELTKRIKRISYLQSLSLNLTAYVRPQLQLNTNNVDLVSLRALLSQLKKLELVKLNLVLRDNNLPAEALMEFMHYASESSLQKIGFDIRSKDYTLANQIRNQFNNWMKKYH